MVKRVLITPGRIIVSKPGKEAAPALGNADKLLDSNWDFTGSIIVQGIKPETAPTLNGASYLTSTSTPITIPFGVTLGYIPAAICYWLRPWSTDNLPVGHSNLAGSVSGGGGFNEAIALAATIYNDRLVVPRGAAGSGYWRYSSGVYYAVYAVD